MQTPSFKPLALEQLPDPDTVRTQLGDAVRAASLLRGLLKLSERAHRERQQRSTKNAADTKEVAVA